MTDVVFARLTLEPILKESFEVKDLGTLVKRYGLHSYPQEVFWVVANDVAGNVRTIFEVGRGSHASVSVDISNAMAAVLMAGASSFSLAHNHPTMSTLPSISDQNLTANFMDAANTLGLLLEEHVIVEPGGDVFSFREAGMIIGETRPKTRAAAVRKKR